MYQELFLTQTKQDVAQVHQELKVAKREVTEKQREWKELKKEHVGLVAVVKKWQERVIEKGEKDKDEEGDEGGKDEIEGGV